MDGPRVRLCATLVAVAMPGCGATASSGDDGDDGDDSPPGADAPRAPIDAPPAPDARPCIEGQMQGTDPSGTCFVAFTTERVPWAMARAQCQAIGGDLAIVTSATENAFLTSLLGANEAFLGGNDLTTEGAFVWVDGTPVTYSNWRLNPGGIDEPNNGGGNYQEDCIVLQGQLAGVWDDRPCDSAELGPPAGMHFFLCERP
jgi:hypothetical protein